MCCIKAVINEALVFCVLLFDTIFAASMKFPLCITALMAIGVLSSPIQKRHTTLQYILVNGVDQGQSAIRFPGTNAPVTSVSSSDLTCNVKNVGVSGVVAAKAGDTITTEYHHENTRTSQFVDPSHKGLFSYVRFRG
jgi:Auxiliary Activity family 9 (formerly GH61)